MKLVIKLLTNTLLGALALILVNLLGKLLNFHIALNIVTAAIVGILGIPGFVLVVVLKIIFPVV